MNTTDKLNFCQKNTLPFLFIVGLLGFFLWNIRSVLTVPILFLSLSYFFWKYRTVEGVSALWTVVSVLFILYLIYILAPIIPIFLLTLLLVIFLKPVVDRLERRKWKRSIAVGVVLFVAVGFIALLLTILVPELIDQVQYFTYQLPSFYDNIVEKYNQIWIPYLKGLSILKNVDWENFNQKIFTWAEQGLAVVPNFGMKLLINFSDWVGQLLNLILVPILAIYLLLDKQSIVDKILPLIPPNHTDLVKNYFNKTRVLLYRWLKGQLVVATFLGVATTIGLWISGVEYPLMIGTLTAILSFIPYIGLIVSLSVALLIGLTTGDSNWIFLKILVTYILVQFIEGNFITPRVMGKAVGISDLGIIIAVAIGAQLFGVMGMIFAVPVSGIVWILVREWYEVIQEKKQEAIEPEPKPPE